MTSERWRHNRYATPTPVLSPLISQDEMVARIEAARLEDAPPYCPTCGTTTPDVHKLKWCGRCQRWWPLTHFSRNRGECDGRQSQCRDCHRARKKARRAQQALFDLGAAS